MAGDLIKSGDAQQYAAEPHDLRDHDNGVEPKVYLTWMTPDPLGAIAAMSSMYSGKVVRSLDEVTDDMRRQSLADVQKTHLKAPLEAVKLHFMIEGVDRAFTHQLVRQRTAVYAQESLRFAVVGDLLDATTVPPSLHGTKQNKPNAEGLHEDPWADNAMYEKPQAWRNKWDRVLSHIDKVYRELVEGGMPAEEARGLLPHCTATRLNYITDLRNLADHAGNRLCTQAQFHWRSVFAQIVKCIEQYALSMDVHSGLEWQFEALATSGIFAPVCYQQGHCPFEASFDRACTIRERVEAFASRGVSSDKWHETYEEPFNMHHPHPLPWGKPDRQPPVDCIPPIRASEWLMDPGAARV